MSPLVPSCRPWEDEIGGPKQDPNGRALLISGDGMNESVVSSRSSYTGMDMCLGGGMRAYFSGLALLVIDGPRAMGGAQH